MKRRYTREMALSNIGRLRRAFPGANFTTDLMVGFPGETEEDFLKTLDFVTEAKLLDAHVFAYSKRDRTPAADYPDQIPENVKKERSARLIAHKNKMRDSLLDGVALFGTELSAIAESIDKDGRISMHSESFIEMKTDRIYPTFSITVLQGRWIKVKPLYHKDGIVYCDIV